MKPTSTRERPASQVDLTRTELPAEGREQYLDYVIDQIDSHFTNTGNDKEISEVNPTQAFGIELTAFTSRQEEIDLIVRLKERGYDAKFYSRPGKSTSPALHWFLVTKLPTA